MDLGGLDWPSLRLDLAARLSVVDRKDSLFLSGRGGNHIRPGMTPIFHVQVGSEPELDSRKSHPAPSADFPAGSIELSSASAVGNTSLIMRNEQGGKHQGRIARTPLDVWEAVFRTPPIFVSTKPYSSFRQAGSPPRHYHRTCL